MQGYELNSSELRVNFLLGCDIICIQRTTEKTANLIEGLVGKTGYWTASTDYGNQGILTIGPASVEIKEVALIQNEYDNSQGKRYHKFMYNNYSMIHQYGCYNPVASKDLYFDTVISEQADFIIGDTHRPRQSDFYENYKILNKLPTFMAEQTAVCIDWIMSKDFKLEPVKEFVPSIDSNQTMKHYPILLTL